MLGRNGSELAYTEMVVMNNLEEAEAALKVFTEQLSEYDDYKQGKVKIDIHTDLSDHPIINLSHEWKTVNIYRFITDGSKLGINVRPKKTPYDQAYSDFNFITLTEDEPVE